MSKHTLEQFTIFPYMAWGLIISFSIFVFIITNSALAEIKSIKQVSPETSSYPLQF